MIKALKALQDKIRALELERAAAAEKFRHLGQQTEQHKQQHNVRLQVNRSSQYSTPPSDTSTEGKYMYQRVYYHIILLCIHTYNVIMYGVIMYGVLVANN